jgi:hypothetical protein
MAAHIITKVGRKLDGSRKECRLAPFPPHRSNPCMRPGAAPYWVGVCRRNDCANVSGLFLARKDWRRGHSFHQRWSRGSSRISSVDVQKVQSTTAPQLVSWLKLQISTIKFLPRCPGQTVDIRLVYRLIDGPEKAARYQPRNEVRFRSPNTFEISAPPPDYQAQP